MTVFVAAHVASEGLAFTLGASGTCYIASGIGTCTDGNVVIPSEYPGLPVKYVGKRAFSSCKTIASGTVDNGK